MYNPPPRNCNWFAMAADGGDIAVVTGEAATAVGVAVTGITGPTDTDIAATTAPMDMASIPAMRTAIRTGTRLTAPTVTHIPGSGSGEVCELRLFPMLSIIAE